MKITKQQLRKIIKEEISVLLSEGTRDEWIASQPLKPALEEMPKEYLPIFWKEVIGNDEYETVAYIAALMGNEWTRLNIYAQLKPFHARYVLGDVNDLAKRSTGGLSPGDKSQAMQAIKDVKGVLHDMRLDGRIKYPKP